MLWPMVVVGFPNHCSDHFATELLVLDGKNRKGKEVAGAVQVKDMTLTRG